MVSASSSRTLSSFESFLPKTHPSPSLQCLDQKAYLIVWTTHHLLFISSWLGISLVWSPYTFQVTPISNKLFTIDFQGTDGEEYLQHIKHIPNVLSPLTKSFIVNIL